MLGAVQCGVPRAARGGPAFAPRAVALGLLRVALALLAAVALERAVAQLGVQTDWTFEGKFEPAPSTLEALAELCAEGEVDTLLFGDDFDPRRAQHAAPAPDAGGDEPPRVRRALARRRCPSEEERYGVGASNTVIVRIARAASRSR